MNRKVLFNVKKITRALMALVLSVFVFTSLAANALPSAFDKNVIIYDSDFYNLPTQYFLSGETRAQSIAKIQNLIENANQVAGHSQYTSVLEDYRVNIAFYTDSQLEQEYNQKKSEIENLSKLPSYCDYGITLEEYQTIDGFKECEKYSWDVFIEDNNLGGYIGMNVSVAEFIWMLSREGLGKNGTWKNSINPLFLLSVIQKEQGLLYGRSSQNSSALNRATGYACPDSGGCDMAFGGFFKQVYFTARWMKAYTKRCNEKSGYWAEIRGFYTGGNVMIDGKSVHLGYGITCSSYIYTPHDVYETFYKIMNDVYYVMDELYPADTVAPVITVNSFTSETASPTITGTVDDSSAKVVVIVNGQTYNATNSNKVWSVLITQELENGTYNVTAKATDSSGNVGQDNTSDELVIAVPIPNPEPEPDPEPEPPKDTTAPKVTVNFLTTQDDTPKLTGTVDDSEATIKVTVNGRTYNAVNQGSSWYANVTSPIPNGKYEVLAQASDKAGNVGVNTTHYELTINKPAEHEFVEYEESDKKRGDVPIEATKESIVAESVEKTVANSKKDKEERAIENDPIKFSFILPEKDGDTLGGVLGASEQKNSDNKDYTKVWMALVAVPFIVVLARFGIRKII